MIAGCANAPIDEPLPCPPRPLLIGLTVEQQLAIEPETLVTIDYDQSQLIEYAERLEIRLECQ